MPQAIDYRPSGRRGTRGAYWPDYIFARREHLSRAPQRATTVIELLLGPERRSRQSRYNKLPATTYAGWSPSDPALTLAPIFCQNPVPHRLPEVRLGRFRSVANDGDDPHLD
jgi:hypothetical protein